ncbi:VanZ family protein [Streptomyces sp. NPDC005393]|uniref:VanZ family protein n=1 Tax=Streptomyces sp. NPDC005393 TaxID=3157041 RepID=UPI0033A26310
MWGVYDCPYRLFDVDDLLVNTAGAVAGWLVAGPVARVLPALETLDGRALAVRPVPFGRRTVALVVDLAGYAVTSTVTAGVLASTGFMGYARWAPVGVFVAWFVLQPMATGATPGKRLLLLRLEALDGGPLAPWRLTVRALVLGVAALPLLAGLFLAMAVLSYDPSLPGLIATARRADGREAATLAALYPGELLMALAALAGVATYALRTLRHPEGLGPHERLSGVRNAALPHSRAARPPENRVVAAREF